MKLPLFFERSLLLLLVSFVGAERVIRFTFNNGIPLPGGETCTAADNLLIDAIFTRNTTVRYLESNSERHESRESPESGQHHRRTPIWPTNCRQDCKGIADNMCKAQGCNGYRRLGGKEDSGRELITLPCVDEILNIDNQLDALITENKVSLGCQKILNSTRFPLCYDDIIFGVVESFNVWNGLTDELIQENATNGFEFCKSIPFNIEVVTNPCVDFITYNVTGNMGFKFLNKTRLAPPYFVFNPGPSDPLPQGPGDIFGRANMRNGTFTVAVTPDSFWHKKKEFEFKLKNC